MRCRLTAVSSRCASMKIEEAALTGESVPVNKHRGRAGAGTGRRIFLWATARTWCTWAPPWYTAAAQAVITGTGMNTEMGKIADALAQAKDEADAAADAS